MRKGFNFWVILMLAIGVVACNRDNKNGNGDILPQFEEYILSVEESGYSVNITYQRMTNTERSAALSHIDELNYKHTFDEYALEPMDVEASARMLVEEYASEEHMSEQAYSYNLDQVVILSRNDEVVCYESYIEVYTGGAHGGQSLIYECYDIATGQAYDFGYLMDGEWCDALRQLIYERIVDMYGDEQLIATAQDIYIPRSVKLTDSGLLLVYQPYEIASFDAGILSVELSDEELAALGVTLLWI